MHFVFENIFLSRELYQSILTPICNKYELTHAELIVLLFLARNPKQNTAADIVKSRRLTKSAVSMAVHSLEEKGILKGKFAEGNHRSIHLVLCDKSKSIVKEGKKAQSCFYDILTEGFSNQEKENLKEYFKRISLNIREYNNSKFLHSPQKRA